jgi:hypothetical protein
VVDQKILKLAKQMVDFYKTRHKELMIVIKDYVRLSEAYEKLEKNPPPLNFPRMSKKRLKEFNDRFSVDSFLFSHQQQPQKRKAKAK